MLLDSTSTPLDRDQLYPTLNPSHLEPALLLPELLQGGSSFSRASPKAQEVSVVALCRQRLPEQQGQHVINLNRI